MTRDDNFDFEQMFVVGPLDFGKPLRELMSLSRHLVGKSDALTDDAMSPF